MKRVAGWLAVALAVASLLFQMGIIVANAAIREQAMALDFPLTSLGEGLIIMVLPMAASALSVLLGAIAVNVRSGRIGLVASAVSWLAICLIVGREGFHTLF